ncbi:hypothetical protein G9F71_010460 [Clostridium sp. FP2]|uniref:hypothetical protein n=1 Tax=Clostridium TaxID=1485 RepID=UPI0013E943BD|nr:MULTISPECIES: hypothetical protein [Clostridium]MBW9158813.1 hypothetical protein [Clostridium tagluense]MBZ9623275.1 hypothetical protein [Clostridium sp. FP2]WLC67427.1 hypothetical protein KTC93_09745 [Clostridium tagluense]
MKIKKKGIVIVLTSIMMCVALSVNVLAAVSGKSAYVNYDGHFILNGKSQATKAKESFEKWGYGCNDPNMAYTKSSVLSAVPTITCFYVSGHGNVGSISTGKNGSESISASEIAAKAAGFYKFVYTDTCLTGSDESFASAFNIKSSDGLNHAYLGWKVETYDNAKYGVFTEFVFGELTRGESLDNAIWLAYSSTGLSGYKVYGKSNMTVK